MFDKQHGVCAICGRENASGRRLAVDHDHKTDDVRGLLCFKRNAALGCVDDNVIILLRMIEYLERHNHIQLPEITNSEDLAKKR